MLTRPGPPGAKRREGVGFPPERSVGRDEAGPARATINRVSKNMAVAIEYYLLTRCLPDYLLSTLDLVWGFGGLPPMLEGMGSIPGKILIFSLK